MDDFIFNGAASGSVAQRLLACNFDVRALRPFIGENGKTYITTMGKNGKLETKMIHNATATLRYEDWKLLDDVIVKAAKPRLKAVGDLRAAGLQYTIPNGMGTTVFQTETMSDIGDASISMDGLRQGANDRLEFDLTNIPLPIIHKDFSYSVRQIATSRNGGSPLDTNTAEAATRKVAEEAEKLLLGLSSTYSFGGGTIYGYTNYLYRMTQILTSPTAGGWTASTLLTEVLAMRTSSQNAYHYGPWVLYVSPAWDAYLDEDFKAASDVTVRERLKKLDGISDIRTLDYLTDYDMILVQMSSDVVREIIGMDFTTVQWPSDGGLKENFKVMCIMVPQIRRDFNGNTGIVHGGVV